MRTLRWTYGRAWIAGRPEEWPADLGWNARAEAAPRTVTLPASTAAAEAAVAVELKFRQEPSYFACLGGHLRPGGAEELVVSIHLPRDCDRREELLEAVVAGIESAPARPAGRLDLSWFAFHPVDFGIGAWRRAAAALCRLLLPDVAGMSAQTAIQTANDAVGVWPRRPGPQLEIVQDAGVLVERAATHIAWLATSIIEAGGRFRIALAGGSTPRALYPKLAGRIDWSRVDVFFGDERAVPPDDLQSNYRMAAETLLGPANVPAANVHRWRAESPDLDAAAREYERDLRAPGDVPLLDLALLGLGPDGHTASLFPGTTALAVEDRLAVANDVPALKTRRLTLTYPALLAASQIMFLVTGREKRAALAEVLRPESTLPAARIIHGPATVWIFCDSEAAQDINLPR